MYNSREESLLGRLSVNSEPIETGVFRMAPVRKNPEFHYLKSSFRPFLKSKGTKKINLFHINTPEPNTVPTTLFESSNTPQGT